ncbi:phosphoglycerate kinase, partial [Patescibacteria group bacterium]
YDIGPRTAEQFAKIISEGKQVLWNGPMGYFERMHFRDGTRAVAEAIANTEAENSVVGGGETVEFLDETGLRDKINFVSTGGGAMLDFLADGKLIALDALK